MLLKLHLRELGLKAYYADLEMRQSHILDKIRDMILKTQFGIFDISNPKKPNVFLELGLAIGAEQPFYIICGSSGQFVGGCEPVRAWVPVDLWITSLLPTGPTGQAGDLWTTSLLPTNPQPYRKCDDRTARGAGRFGLGEHPAPISGKMAACTNHRYPEGGERDAGRRLSSIVSRKSNRSCMVRFAGWRAPPPRLWKWNCILGPMAGRCVRAVGRAARGTTGCRPGASSSSRFGG